jgi:histidinol-phosphate/aromatic aminotransferase/cobyric acid decarboxylase-like protein
MAVQDPAISSHLSSDLHRYPDPAQNEIKSRIAELRNVKGTDHIFLGVGSDEVIDLLMRVCCRPEHDKILITPPTYGMYGVTAQVNDIGIVKVPLLVEKGEFQLDMDGVCYQYCLKTPDFYIYQSRSKRPLHQIPPLSLSLFVRQETPQARLFPSTT